MNLGNCDDGDGTACWAEVIARASCFFARDNKFPDPAQVANDGFSALNAPGSFADRNSWSDVSGATITITSAARRGLLPPARHAYPNEQQLERKGPQGARGS
jgi:hypothetical protein